MVRTLATLLILTACLSPLQAQDEVPVVRDREFDIVLVHGLGSSADVWNDITAPLNLAFNVWAFEMPGHGKTQPVADASIASFAELLRGLHRGQRHPQPRAGRSRPRRHGGHDLRVRAPRPGESAGDHRRRPQAAASGEQKAAIAQQLLNNYDRFVAGYYMNMSPREDVNEQVLDQALRTDKITFQQLMMSSFDFDLTDELSLQAIPILLIGSAMMFPDPAFAQDQLDPHGLRQRPRRELQDHARAGALRDAGGSPLHGQRDHRLLPAVGLTGF